MCCPHKLGQFIIKKICVEGLKIYFSEDTETDKEQKASMIYNAYNSVLNYFLSSSGSMRNYCSIDVSGSDIDLYNAINNYNKIRSYINIGIHSIELFGTLNDIKIKSQDEEYVNSEEYKYDLKNIGDKFLTVTKDLAGKIPVAGRLYKEIVNISQECFNIGSEIISNHALKLEFMELVMYEATGVKTTCDVLSILTGEKFKDYADNTEFCNYITALQEKYLAELFAESVGADSEIARIKSDHIKSIYVSIQNSFLNSSDISDEDSKWLQDLKDDLDEYLGTRVSVSEGTTVDPKEIDTITAIMGGVVDDANSATTKVFCKR